jgi:hypothetical protein
MFLKSLKQNYPHLFLLLSIVILLVGLLYRGEDTTLDINVHDTYYVIEHILINIFFSILSFFIWTIYFLLRLFRFKMNGKLIIAQFLIHTLSIIGMMFPMIFIFDKNNFNPSLFQDPNFLIFIFFGLFLISIILFVIILAMSIFNKFKK